MTDRDNTNFGAEARGPRRRVENARPADYRPVEFCYDVTFGFVRGLDIPSLQCPCCGGGNLHHDRTTAFVRSKEDGGGISVAVDPGKGDIFSSDSGAADINVRSLSATEINKQNPSNRRDGIRVNFWCETCSGDMALILAQHKGNTVLAWEIYTQPIEI